MRGILALRLGGNPGAVAVAAAAPKENVQNMCVAKVRAGRKQGMRLRERECDKGKEREREGESGSERMQQLEYVCVMFYQKAQCKDNENEQGTEIQKEKNVEQFRLK